MVKQYLCHYQHYKKISVTKHPQFEIVLKQIQSIQELLYHKKLSKQMQQNKKVSLCRYALIQIWFMQKSAGAVFCPWRDVVRQRVAVSYRMSQRHECDIAAGNRATVRLFHHYFSTHLFDFLLDILWCIFEIFFDNCFSFWQYGFTDALVGLDR